MSEILRQLAIIRKQILIKVRQICWQKRLVMLVAMLITLTHSLHTKQTQTNHTHLFTHNVNTPDKYPELNHPFSFNELYSAVQQSKIHSSQGKDRISYEMLQHFPNKCLKVILKLYNQVYLSGQRPTVWKHSIVIGCPNPSKDESLPTSYRPISLTSTTVRYSSAQIQID